MTGDPPATGAAAPGATPEEEARHDPPPFWRRKTLAQMTRAEWESLCDGCGKCCLVRLEDEDTGDIYVTDVACRLLDLGTCRCGDYADRKRHVPDCVVLRPDTVPELTWMPSTCAYRLLAEGRDLYWWHPLVSGDPETVVRAGQSARGRVVPEDSVPVEALEDHIVEWPE
ncbi:MAG: YcgN family cysteine cluster protein [Azospirillaceae bacterium]